ncbi:hypothetical protein MRBLMR1_001710 [Neorhizobium sp. LMR1-1-1.1]
MKKFLVAAALLAACGPVSAEENPYTGAWTSTGCGKGIQCRIEIEQKSKTAYGLRFVVADGRDARKVRCEVSADMERGPLEFTKSHHYDDGLMGRFPDDTVWLVINGGGDISLTTLQKCKGVEIYGDYGFIGD